MKFLLLIVIVLSSLISRIDNVQNKLVTSLNGPSGSDTLPPQFKPKEFLIKSENVNPIDFKDYKTATPNTTPSVDKVETQIFFNKQIADGVVTERVTYELPRGIYNTLTHKISLGGTTLRHYDIKLTTVDLKLQSAKIVRDCYDSNTIYYHPYICVISYFDDIDIPAESQKIQIEYEYLAEGLLRQRTKPYMPIQENVMIWVYDNYGTNKAKEVSLIIKFQDKVKGIKAYPERYQVDGKAEADTDDVDGVTTISWDKFTVRANDYQNFAIDIPLFNNHSKEMVRYIN
jgi:hypothetical protein